MAHSAHTDPEQIRERYDNPDVLEQKLDKLAAIVRRSKHFVIFTGAGISTDAGIPDFRGPDGVWTLKAQGRQRQGRTVSTLSAVPTATHMSIVSLQNQGICKYLISQNCDGLHRRSGISPDMISELHGNGNIEYCEDCGYEYLRDYHCTRVRPGSDHYTGRHCLVPVGSDKACGGRLMNSTIDFGQELPQIPMTRGFDHSKVADLHLVLGSSLTVSPACNMPLLTSKVGGKLIICNLQNTPLDSYAYMHIYARCDTVMKGLMDRLNLPVPTWSLKRTVTYRVSQDENSRILLKFGAVERGTKGQTIPASVLKYVEIVSSVNGRSSGDTTNAEPFEFSLVKDVSEVRSRIHFMGHYKEPSLDLKIDISSIGTQTFLWLEYDPYHRKWSISRATRVPVSSSESLCLLPSEKEGMALQSTDILLKNDEKCYEEGDYLRLFGDCSLSLKSVTTGSAPSLSCVLSLSSNEKEIERKEEKGKGKEEEEKREREEIMMGYCQSTNRLTQFKISSRESNSRPCKCPSLPSLLTRSGFSLFQFESDTFENTYIFGGADANGSHNDLQNFNRFTKSVTPISVIGEFPSPRSFQSATPVSRSVVVFGGVDCDGKFLNDCYVLHMSKTIWKKLSISGTPPSPRASHSALLVDHRTLAIFGGFDGKSYLTDIHLLDLVELKWREIEPPGGSSPPSVVSKSFDPKYLTVTSSPTISFKSSGRNAEYLSGPHLLVFPTFSSNAYYALNLVKWIWTTISTPSSSLRDCTLTYAKDLGRGEILLYGQRRDGERGEGEGRENEKGEYVLMEFMIVKR